LKFISIAATSILLIVPSGFAQSPLVSQRQSACEDFKKAVVRIEAGGKSRGTGFIVSEDGFIFTAAHVIRDEAGEYYSVIQVTLPDGSIPRATAVPLTVDSVGQDYAIIKVEGKSGLPFLPLGSDEDTKLGSDAVIIGYPFSALTVQDRHISIKFCLSAMIAASDEETIPIAGTNHIGQRNIPFNKDVKVDVIYFQGPSVKGVSGSPLISLRTGNVIGIVSTKLAGIGLSLKDLQSQTAHGLGSGVLISGLNPGSAVNEIVTVLDDQLANGLGSAVGIGDPAHALAQAKRNYRRQKK